MTMKRNARVSLCGEVYTRPDGDRFVCQFLGMHNGKHSWANVEAADEEANRLPAHVAEAVLLIDQDAFDTYIELLLTHLHNRKRRVKGTPGLTLEEN